MSDARLRRKQRIELKRKKQSEELAQQVAGKIHSFLWMAGAVALVYYTDLIRVILSSQETNRVTLNLGLAAAAGLVLILVHITFISPTFLGRRISLSVTKSPEIKVGALFFASSTILLCIGLWPVFGLLTPVIQLVVFVGMLNALHFVPSFVPILGTVASEEDHADAAEDEWKD
eukprot:g3080.t1